MTARTFELRRPRKRASIKAEIKRMISGQRLRLGERIPGQVELAAHFQTTVVTIHRALSELEAEGILHRENGSGTFVGPVRKTQMAMRTACLVLPGLEMDRPEVNPDYWPYVRQLMHAFHNTLRTPWRFTTLGVPPGTRPKDMTGELSQHDAIFFYHGKEPYDLLRHLVDNRVAPVVAFGLPRPDLHCLTIDHNMVEGVRQSVACLVGLGYRRIAYVGSGEDWGRFWFEGYRQGLDDFGLPHDKAREVKVGHWTQAEGARAASMLVQRGLPCDAILVDSDMRALGLVEHLRQEGVRVPQDVGVMGYGGLENVTSQPPFLASFGVPLDRMIRAGIEAVEQVLEANGEQARGLATPEKHLKLLGNLVPGRTVMKVNAAKRS